MFGFWYHKGVYQVYVSYVVPTKWCSSEVLNASSFCTPPTTFVYEWVFQKKVR